MTFNVTNTADSGAGSLRDAITQANTNNNDSEVDIITFFSTLLDSQITLTSSQLTVSSPLSIQGLGADRLSIARDANAASAFRVFGGEPCVACRQF